MEEIILQQMESLENTLKFQARKIHIFESHLKELAKIEANFITFGSLSDEQQLDKQIILSQYL